MTTTGLVSLSLAFLNLHSPFAFGADVHRKVILNSSVAGGKKIYSLPEGLVEQGFEFAPPYTELGQLPGVALIIHCYHNGRFDRTLYGRLAVPAAWTETDPLQGRFNGDRAMSAVTSIELTWDPDTQDPEELQQSGQLADEANRHEEQTRELAFRLAMEEAKLHPQDTSSVQAELQKVKENKTLAHRTAIERLMVAWAVCRAHAISRQQFSFVASRFRSIGNQAALRALSVGKEFALKQLVEFLISGKAFPDVVFQRSLNLSQLPPDLRRVITEILSAFGSQRAVLQRAYQKPTSKTSLPVDCTRRLLEATTTHQRVRTR